MWETIFIIEILVYLLVQAKLGAVIPVQKLIPDGAGNLDLEPKVQVFE